MTDIVLVSEGEGVILRGVPLPRDTSPGALRAFVRDRFGIDAVLLHDGGLSLGRQGVPVLMEALGPFPKGLMRTAWQLPPNSRPWGRPGWFSDVKGWLERVLGPRGERVLSVEQVSTYDLACVLRVHTTNGDMYLKASVDSLESVITSHLARSSPHLVPDVLAVRETHGWLLTRSSGERLSGAPDIEVWSEAFVKLARFHRADGTLKGLGLPIHDFGTLAERAEAFLRDRTALTNWGLRAEQVDALAELLPHIRRAHERVSALGLSEGPCHGDAQPMNALFEASGSVRWFDWSEAGVAHPFLDVGWCLAWMMNPARETLPVCRAFDNVPARLWRAYLEALNAPNAEDLMGDAIVLAMTHRAVVYSAKYASFTPTVSGWRPQYAPYYLKQVLKLAHL